jgi:hypothetical protein
MENLPSSERDWTADAVLVRWMGVSSLSQNFQRDSSYRPVCEYPLSANHCLYQWSDVGHNRPCIRRVRQQYAHFWNHLPENQRRHAMASEYRAWYDVINYDSILGFTNISPDPSTGHMLQTIQMI